MFRLECAMEPAPFSAPVFVANPQEPCRRVRTSAPKSELRGLNQQTLKTLRNAGSPSNVFPWVVSALLLG